MGSASRKLPVSGHTMSRSAYSRKINELKSSFPWMAKFKLEPAPGHLELVRELLADIESIFAGTTIKRLRFLRIIHEGGNLAIYYSQKFIRDMRLAALNQCITANIDKSVSICPACGAQNGLAYTGFKQMTLCKAHYQKCGDALFKEDFAAPEKNLTNEPLSNNIEAEEVDKLVMTYRNATKDFELSQFETTSLFSNIDEQQKTIKIRFIDKTSLDRFNKKIDQHTKENQPLIDIALNIKAAGGHTRQLLSLPENWAEIIDSFEEKFPNFQKVADVLRDYFSLSSVGDKAISFPPLLFVGEAGIGKTEAAGWLAKNLALPFRIIDMASAQTGSALSGSEKFWSNSKPGQIFDLLTSEPYANPIVMLDELDKVIRDSRFDPIAPLYTLLEPNSAQKFIDLSFTEFSVNASYINWIATANSINTIPIPIQSRLIVIEIPKPNNEQIEIIIHNIFADILKNITCSFSNILRKEVMHALKKLPPRAIKILLGRAIGSAIRNGRNEIAFYDIGTLSQNESQGIGFLAAI